MRYFTILFIRPQVFFRRDPMKVIHLISGGDTGGAKTHVHMLLQNLGKSIDVTMV